MRYIMKWLVAPVCVAVTAAENRASFQATTSFQVRLPDDYVEGSMGCAMQEGAPLEEQMGCMILNQRSMYIGAVRSGDFTRDAGPLSTRMFNNSMVEEIVRKCFTVSTLGPTGRLTEDDYTFTDMDTYSSTLEQKLDIDVSASANFMGASAKISYRQNQVYQNQLVYNTAISRKRVFKQLEAAVIYNTCTQNMERYVNPETLTLWEQLKEQPENEEHLSKWWSQIGSAYPSQFTVGMTRSFDLTSSLLENSSFDSEEMRRVLDASMKFVFGFSRAEAKANVEAIYNKEIKKTSMKTSITVQVRDEDGCLNGLLSNQNFTYDEEAALRKECMEIYEANMAAWSAPFKIGHYISTIDAMIQVGDPGYLEQEISLGMYNALTPCIPLRYQAFLMTLNSGKSIQYLSCTDWKIACTFVNNLPDTFFEQKTGSFEGRYDYVGNPLNKSQPSGTLGAFSIPDAGHTVPTTLFPTEPGYPLSGSWYYNQTAEVFLNSASSEGTPLMVNSHGAVETFKAGDGPFHQSITHVHGVRSGYFDMNEYCDP
mmetsp:Transcript_18707/g.40503  ORF Transcript_18707/g.40503 Transcript_18707/m.40503 type:complete len:539 (-) Transcript_18707:26-1642(-)